MDSEFWLFLFFGIPTWALVDGTWSSLAQLADHLPEGYSISAYLILSLTVGNIFPLAIGYLMERSFSSQFLRIIISSILCIGFLCGIFMGIFYQSSVKIDGSDVSLPLCLLFFVVGACSSTSNVTHFTFVSQYSAANTTALGTGMGVGSMIAGLLGILQGVWLIDYGFTTTIYYITLSLLYLPAMYCFYQLERNHPAYTTSQKLEKEKLIAANFVEESNHAVEIIPPQSHSVDRITMITALPSSFSLVFIKHFASILCLQAFNSSLGYGFVPALISFACGKFPNANIILLFATGTAAIVDPWTKYLTNYFRLVSFQQLLTASSLLASLTGGLILCSSLPDNSSFYHESASFLPVVCYIVFNGLFGYTNLCIFRYFKEQAIHDFSFLSSQVMEASHSQSSEDKQEQIDQMIQLAYRYCGVASQTGALLGSVFAFSLVVSNTF